MRVLLWDMNGVLVDDEPVQQDCWAQALHAAHVTLDPGWWEREFLGRKVTETLPRILPDWEPRRREQLLADKQRRYHAAADRGLPEGPGAAEMVRAAADGGWKQAVVTSAQPEEVERVLSQLGVGPMMDLVVCGADVRHGKPHPEGFLAAAGRLDVSPDQCWVIEDAPSGVQAACAAGSRCVGLTTSYPEAVLLQSGADLVASRLSASLLGQLTRIQ